MNSLSGFCSMSIDVDVYNSLGLWEKKDEHASVDYIPSTKESVREWVIGTQNLPNRSMPVSQATILYSHMVTYGVGSMLEIINEMNEKFPIGYEHPFYSRVEKLQQKHSKGRNAYNFQTLFQNPTLAPNQDR